MWCGWTSPWLWNEMPLSRRVAITASYSSSPCVYVFHIHHQARRRIPMCGCVLHQRAVVVVSGGVTAHALSSSPSNIALGARYSPTYVQRETETKRHAHTPPATLDRDRSTPWQIKEGKKKVTAGEGGRGDGDGGRLEAVGAVWLA